MFQRFYFKNSRDNINIEEVSQTIIRVVMFPLFERTDRDFKILSKFFGRFTEIKEVFFKDKINYKSCGIE